MQGAPRERPGFGPWARFPRNAVFFAALLTNVVLAINLWDIAPRRSETGFVFVERALTRTPERTVVETRLEARKVYALLGLVLLLSCAGLAVTPTLFGKDSAELRWGGRALALLPPLMLGLMLYANWYRTGGA